MRPISIGITTRDRPASLRACLQSIQSALSAGHDVMVFDDGSSDPASRQVDALRLGIRVRVLRGEGSGYIAGRNALVRAARHDLVLLLDDDAVLLDGAAIQAGVDVMQTDPSAGAVAFAQAERDGRPWPEAMQPGMGQSPAVVPSYIGFAHLLRRSLFLELGGYRERLVFYGEEKDYCLRLLDSGHRVIYLPRALVAHVPDPAGRDARRYVRYAIRNDCLTSLYSHPWPLALGGLGVRLLRYRRMAAAIPGGDPGGLSWLLGELKRELRFVRAGRRPVRWRAIARWRRLAGGLPYQPAVPRD
jgi:GT2 family glycosyltransferase